jgi:hypothetical protein
MTSPDEALDLARLARALATRARSQPRDYLPGKTWMRTVLAELLECSLVEAEELVDTLEARRLVRFSGDPEKIDPAGGWTFHPAPD